MDISALVGDLKNNVQEIMSLVDSDPDCLGSLSIEDYMWIYDVVRISYLHEGFSK